MTSHTKRIVKIYFSFEIFFKFKSDLKSKCYAILFQNQPLKIENKHYDKYFLDGSLFFIKNLKGLKSRGNPINIFQSRECTEGSVKLIGSILAFGSRGPLLVFCVVVS